MQLVLWLCFKFNPSGQNSSFIVLRYVMCFSLSVINDQIPWEGAILDNTGINETYWKPRWCLERDWERDREGRMTDCIKKARSGRSGVGWAIRRPVRSGSRRSLGGFWRGWRAGCQRDGDTVASGTGVKEPTQPPGTLETWRRWELHSTLLVCHTHLGMCATCTLHLHE